MWLIILIIAILIVGNAIYAKQEQKVKIEKEGGMYQKYSELINTLLSGHSNTKIERITGDSVTLEATSIGGSTTYILQQVGNRLAIKWIVNSPVFGKHHLDFMFHEYEDQSSILEKMANDIGKYHENVAKAQGFRE